ncbi:H/ACA ribonucleoprotein complex subunit GAR1 [Halorhabdus sp. CUG00001]|uniref:H/ACA ribonucleoprotein complex subunit GAR1 n=1 Tax=Halorhabdus sp. CUG00001 TaxID=2600297 RepID=UPI00131C5096|nr:Gar1/Naf1 family protein [Halorhabdus sp. CUG00001]
MRRAGEVRGLAQGVAVLQCEDETYPDIGTEVIDESLETVGRVVDVFGPVEQPYLAVTIGDSVHPPTLVGETLYAR